VGSFVTVIMELSEEVHVTDCNVSFVPFDIVPVAVSFIGEPCKKLRSDGVTEIDCNPGGISEEIGYISALLCVSPSFPVPPTINTVPFDRSVAL